MTRKEVLQKITDLQIDNGVRRIGDEGVEMPLFNNLKVLVETDPDGI